MLLLISEKDLWTQDVPHVLRKLFQIYLRTTVVHAVYEICWITSAKVKHLNSGKLLPFNVLRAIKQVYIRQIYYYYYSYTPHRCL
jgi:hypothetical protein